jgi:hypothetical protein
MSVANITREIVTGSLSNDELNQIADAIRFARSQLTQQNRRSLVIGTKVKFSNTKTGQTMTGTIDKMALKFATVTTPQGRWRVPASMLEAV